VPPFQAPAAAYVADHFGQGVGAYGLLFAFEALGMTVGTIVFDQTMLTVRFALAGLVWAVPLLVRSVHEAA